MNLLPFLSIRHGSSLARLLFCALSAPITLAHQGHVISGRVVDPHQLRPQAAEWMLVQGTSNGSGSVPVPVGKDGSFVTQALSPGTYVLEVVRTPHSIAMLPSVVGFSMVTVGAADVSDVTVEVRRDTTITGRFRMESDNPKAAWPPHIVVTSALALDGMPMMNSVDADGAAGGKFVLRNAFGPRILRCGYQLAPGEWWWPSRVILDGVDITNVPTDFSAHEGGNLEVVFTQHPARIAGTVTDSQQGPVRAPWILISAADRKLWQQWAATTDAAQGDTLGRFAMAVLPGRYLVRAVSQATFSSWTSARDGILRFATTGVPVEVSERKVTKVKLIVR